MGVDEVGRGCLAGPVMAGAVALKPGSSLPEGLKDSKKLSPQKREEFSRQIRELCYVSIGSADPLEIQRLNILRASLLAMRRAVEALSKDLPSHLSISEVQVDGNQAIPNLSYPQKMWIQGDSRQPLISAASIVAKVFRDTYMLAQSLQYPEYGFESHKGYGTKAHKEAIQKFGPTKLHRAEFAGVKEFL